MNFTARRPLDTDMQRQRKIRKLKNRRDTLVMNIVKFHREGNMLGVNICRQEANNINSWLNQI